MSKQLHSSALAYIYHEQLFVIPGEAEGPAASGHESKPSNYPEEELPPTIKKAEEPTVQYTGNTSQGIVILHKENIQEHIGETNRIFLSKILQACKVSIEDTIVVNVHNQKVDFEKLVGEFGMKKALLFGVDTFEVNVKDQQPLKYELAEVKGISLLLADDLDKIAGEVEKKKALWLSLQRLFGITT